MMNGYVFLFPVTIMFSTMGGFAQDLHLESPDRRIRVVISNDHGQLLYRVLVEGNTVIAPSYLGMLIEGDGDKATLEIKEKNIRAIDNAWSPVWGKRSQVRNRYNELDVTAAVESSSRRRMRIVFRAYDEGVAFRYVLGSEDRTPRQLTVLEELSTVNLPRANSQVWSYVPENRPKGPERIADINGARRYPLVLKDPGGHWLTLTEAALEDLDYFDVTFRQGEPGARIRIDRCHVTTPFATPWRVMMISKNPNTFVDSNLLVNLSPPPEGDFSWVKPGISLWDWRVWGHQAKDGFTYEPGINSWRRFIDFATEHDISYLLVDANWYGPEHSTLSDPFQGGKAAQVKQALDYGKEKGVGLILYLNDKASVNFNIEDIAKAYSDWGAVGIKYGFMRGRNQEKVQKTERIVRACAKNRLLINFHDGPIPPTGHERTWPHWITREYVHAQSDAKRTHSPGDFVHMAYVNSIAGPLDGNHGMFDHNNAVAQRPKVFKELYSTIVAEAARTLILYSGLTVIPDSPDSYKEHPELFKFIVAQKQPWKQSRTLAGEFGQWVTTMRQAQDNTYLIATATDESSRTAKIPLTFLESGKTYRATIFQDAKEAHYKTNRTAYSLKHRNVTAQDNIEAYLAPGGGHCVIITEKQ